MTSVSQNEAQPEKTEDESIDYKQWYQKLTEFFDKFLAQHEPERQVLSHKGLEKRLQQLENPKHATQQGSLIGHMEKIGLLDNRHLEGTPRDNVIVEFGCGRGELSRYVSRAQLFPTEDEKSKTISYNPNELRKFLLIDRAGPRMKFDSKLLKDYNEESEETRAGVPEPWIERLRVDIKDLNLNKALELLFSKEESTSDRKSVSAISKHLCGCATDLTLQCLANNTVFPQSQSTFSSHRLEGIVIALCCRHLCSYEMYPLAGRQFLKDHQIASTPQEFKVLAKMTSWAVCGRRDPNKPETNDGNNGQHPSGLEVEERERAGLLARRCIDYGRLVAVRDLGLSANLYEYVSPEVSLENVALVAKWQ